MGDHNAHIKVEIEFHGIQRELDAYVGWYDNGYDELGPETVREFFADVYEAGMAKWNEETAEVREAEQKARTEAYERRELERLRAKYPQEATP